MDNLRHIAAEGKRRAIARLKAMAEKAARKGDTARAEELRQRITNLEEMA